MTMSPISCHLHYGRPEIKERGKKYASIQGAPHAFRGCRYSLVGEGGILTSMCVRINRCPASNDNSVFSRRTKDGEVNEG